MSVNTVLGVIWVTSALGFFVLTLVAVWSFICSMSTARLSIISFTASWYLITMDNTFVRFGVRIQELNTDTTTVVIRAMGAISLWWVVIVFIFMGRREEVIP